MLTNSRHCWCSYQCHHYILIVFCHVVPSQRPASENAGVLTAASCQTWTPPSLQPVPHHTTHSLMHSFIHSFTHSFIHSFIQCSNCQLPDLDTSESAACTIHHTTHSFLHSFIRSLTHSCIQCSSFHLRLCCLYHTTTNHITHSFMHSVTHSFSALAANSMTWVSPTLLPVSHHIIHSFIY